MEKQVVNDILALTPMQEYWLEKLNEAYAEFTKYGGELFGLMECSDYVLAMNTNGIKKFDEENYIDLLDYSNGLTETKIRIIEHLDEYPITLNIKK